MTEKDIKPIPQYIIAKIKKLDKNTYRYYPSQTRFYAYLAIWKKELVKVTVAVKVRHKKWLCKQVAVHGVHSDICFIKDITFYRISGYVVGWFEQGVGKTPKWYESPDWDWQIDKLFDPYAPVVNLEVIDKLPEYKYSTYRLYPYCDILKYLRLYERYPHTELLLKLGLFNYATKQTLLNKLAKNKVFRHWFLSHKDELKSKPYYVSTLFKAFKENKDLPTAQKEEERLKSFYANRDYKNLHKHFRKDAFRLIDYVKEQRISPQAYYDYFYACTALGLDMSITKNRYPHDFKRWHDIRTDQYSTNKVEIDKKMFAKIANKYLSLQNTSCDNFICIIAQSPDELVNEGNALHHCVGRMNYEHKFLREETLIFFVRNKNTPDVPFFTIEYSLSQRRILQCHGDDHAEPKNDVKQFVDEIWLPHANKQIRRLASSRKIAA